MSRRLPLLALLAFVAGGAAAQPTQQDQYREAQERYEQGVRDAAAARARYEAEVARHNREVEQAREAQADYQRRLDSRQDRSERRNAREENRGSREATREAAREERRRARAARDINEQCRRRARGRGRLIGGLIGGIAGGIVGNRGGSAAEMVAISAPISLLVGEAITRLLDCREQEQAATATEQAVQQAADSGAQRAVGTTVNWTSETRPNVTGSSTVVALEEEAGGAQCMTVTDIVIVDGRETRAPKRMCRRPPSQRFVRV